MFGRDNVKDIFTVGECWAGDIDEIRRHIDYDRGELSTLFQFDHLEAGRVGKFTPGEKNLKKVRDKIVMWQLKLQDFGLIHSLFTDNHDNAPFISRVADDHSLRYESATCVAAMFYLLRGIPFIYQGQEIGITTSSYDSMASFNDLECFNAYQEFLKAGCTEKEALNKVNFGSRDNARRPFAWDNSRYAGFSTHEPWLPIASRADEINLAIDQQAEKSVFRFYRDLLRLRREEPALRRGVTDVISAEEDNFFIFTRTLDDRVFTVVCNFEQPSAIEDSKGFGSEILHNYLDRKAGNTAFRPYEIAVFVSNHQ